MALQQDYLSPCYKILRENPGTGIWNFRHFLILAITVQYKFYALGLQCLKWSNFSFRNVYSFIDLSEATLFTTKMWIECLTNSGYLWLSSLIYAGKNTFNTSIKSLAKISPWLQRWADLPELWGPAEKVDPASCRLSLSPSFTRQVFSMSMYCIQHCFICRPSDSIVSEDAGIDWSIGTYCIMTPLFSGLTI